ncbi:hypothetical protein [Kribbella sp. DT2]|uniref:hypothetical protein n=1 Tax=Kribbella sp. DT2 TaxID=3393427 RepID=UPI003CF6384B
MVLQLKNWPITGHRFGFRQIMSTTSMAGSFKSISSPWIRGLNSSHQRHRHSGGIGVGTAGEFGKPASQEWAIAAGQAGDRVDGVGLASAAVPGHLDPDQARPTGSHRFGDRPIDNPPALSLWAVPI